MTIIYIIVGVAIGMILVWILLQKKPKHPEENTAGFQILMSQMNELTRTIDNKLGESQKNMTEAVRYQTSESQKIIRDITEKLVRLDETNKQVVSFADQLQNLQYILKNPKQRGILGEYYLETLLKNVMPPGSYEMQYALGQDENGRELIPDAVVFVKEKIIPIDSKFSLENYNRILEATDPNEKDRFEKLFVTDLKTELPKPLNISNLKKTPWILHSCSFHMKQSTMIY